MAERLTDKLVKELPAPERGNKITYDAEVRGLGVRVTTARLMTYIFNYRVKGSGTERRVTMGDAGRWETEEWKSAAWTLKKARERAKELRRQVDAGEDPMGNLH